VGLLSALTKAGVAKKVYDARKPENQRKLNGLVSKVRGGGTKQPRR
jgi:hypothetical protein